MLAVPMSKHFQREDVSIRLHKAVIEVSKEEISDLEVSSL